MRISSTVISKPAAFLTAVVVLLGALLATNILLAFLVR